MNDFIMILISMILGAIGGYHLGVWRWKKIFKKAMKDIKKSHESIRPIVKELFDTCCPDEEEKERLRW